MTINVICTGLKTNAVIRAPIPANDGAFVYSRLETSASDFSFSQIVAIAHMLDIPAKELFKRKLQILLKENFLNALCRHYASKEYRDRVLHKRI